MRFLLGVLTLLTSIGVSSAMAQNTDLRLDAWRSRIKNTPWIELWANDRTLAAFASDRVRALSAKRYEFWVKWMETSLEDGSKYGMGQYDSLVDKWEVDCKKMMYRSGHGTFYHDRNVVRTDYPEELSAWKESIPESYADAVVRATCKEDSIVKVFALSRTPKRQRK